VSTGGYIAVAWLVTFAVVAAYALWILRRGRELTEQVPEDERRWMTSRAGAGHGPDGE
jgi:heme exporter protein CcmD